MVTSVVSTAPQFAGTAAQKRLAAAVYALATSQGRFMSVDAPIRITVEAVAAYLAGTDQPADPAAIEAAVKVSSSVFAIEREDDRVVIVTSRAGTTPFVHSGAAPHSFVQRFMTPLPKPEVVEKPDRPRVRVAPSWATWEPSLEDLVGQPLQPEFGDLSVTIERPGLAVPALDEVDATLVEALPEEVEEVEDEPLAAPEPAARTITVPVLPSFDVASVDDVELADAIRERLRADIRVANFGEQWMAEENVPRFSRGDLRRMKDYILEQEQPLTDDVLVQDVLMVRPNAPDFDLVRFAVNFRLSREHREFDFVGTANQRFWSSGGLPQIGTSRRKPNEIGTDFRYLLDETAETPEYRSSTSVDHIVTFYEYHHGLLPYDAELQALFPGPVLPDQRSAVFTFETPQSYTTYLVELRFPTPNRGGFVLGLDDFFAENLVPGALISISRTENDGHYTVEYLPASSQQARLLELDERRAQRYVFRPTTYACEVADEWLLSEERFPGLGSEKPLDEKVRRRSEAVVSATFERVGKKSDEPGYSVAFQDLLAAVNVERPFSERYLRNVLETDETGAFARDPDGSHAYTYVPSTGI